METGLGGRFDSVTACNANIFGFTSISMDHNHILGNNLRMIAKEKIAAIQKNAQVYSVKQKSITEALITKKCIERRCSYHFIKTNKFSPKIICINHGIYSENNLSHDYFIFLVVGHCFNIPSHGRYFIYNLAWER